MKFYIEKRRIFKLTAVILNTIDTHHTGSRVTYNYGGLHTFQVRGDGQTTILTKGYNAALSVRQFSTATQTPVVFKVMGDGSG